ncbi:MAG: hypothetical protein ACREGJ_01850 [Candidatus Saccharimonadales bacterium]
MWTKSDLAWLSKNYPELKQKQPNTIEGRLTFQMLRANGLYVVNPSAKQIQDLSPPDYLYLCDTYKIRIAWPKDARFPTAHETGGKLAATAKRLNKNLLDMHQYQEDGSLCLAATMQLERTFRKKFKLDAFVEEFMIPYLFAQTHYAKTEEWLWGELEHGSWGLLQWLGREKQYDDADTFATYAYVKSQIGEDATHKLLKIRPRGHYACLCGSGKKTRDCHPDVQQGIIRLRGAVSRHIIKLN